MVRLRRLWLAGLASSGLVVSACTKAPQTTQPTEMNLDRAILLTKAWCNRSRESFDKAKVSANGDFRGVFGAAEIIYSTNDKKLSVEGLVIHNATVMSEYPELFDRFKRAGERELYTLGEGYFYIEKTSTDGSTPQLTLRKDFQDGSINTRQFVLEVDWLMRWSTYWRLQRGHTVFGASEEQLTKDAPGIEAWARKNNPRPW